MRLLKLVELMMEVVYNLILIITNKLLKYAYFLLYKDNSKLLELAYTF